MRSLLWAAVLVATPAAAAVDADGAVRRIVASQPYRAATAALDTGHDQWVANIIKITEVPAPPFKEEVRAKAFAEMLRARGCAFLEVTSNRKLEKAHLFYEAIGYDRTSFRFAKAL